MIRGRGPQFAVRSSASAKSAFPPGEREVEGASLNLALRTTHFGLLAVFVGFALRVFELGELQVWGDGAFSVYLAGLDVPALLAKTAVDSHPPLYYLLLKGWLALAGWSELSVRYLSVAPGVLAIAATFALGRRLFGGRTAAAAALLLAASPFAVTFARLPRMYALLLLLAALLAYLADRLARPAGEVRRRGARAAFVATATALVYTHYYGLLAVGAAAVYVWLLRRHEKRSAAPDIETLGLGALPVLLLVPWLVYALAPSFAHTRDTIVHQPAPANLGAFWLVLWLGLNGGQLLRLDVAAALATGVGLIALAALAYPRRRAGLAPAQRAYLVAWLLLPVVAASLVFLALPQFGRVRFLLFLLPACMLAITAALGGARRFGLAATAAVLVLYGVADLATYRYEAAVWEEDARQLAQTLAGHASDADAVVLQAAWQIGYLRLHLANATPAYFALEDVDPAAAERIGRDHRALWLAMYRTGPRDPAYPLEAWLDARAARGTDIDLTPTRLVPYSFQESAPRPVGTTFGGLFRLDGASPVPPVAAPGVPLAVDLEWTALAPPGRNYSSFVHLVDAQGRGWAGHDAEPEAGRTPTRTWTPGVRQRDRHLLLLPASLPPGVYTLRAGWHASGETARLTLPDGADFVALGELRVAAATPPPRPAIATLGDAVALEEARVVPDAGERWITGEVLTADGPLSIRQPAPSYRPGERVRLTLAWRCLAPLDRDYTVLVHLIGADGAPVAQADGPPAAGFYPTARWRPGEQVREERILALPEGTPAGTYRLLVGLYRHPDLRRLPVHGPARGPADTAQIAMVRVD